MEGVVLEIYVHKTIISSVINHVTSIKWENEYYSLPTKLARDESRSLPRALLAAIAGLVGTIEIGAGCPAGAMVGIRRSPRPSNTGIK